MALFYTTPSMGASQYSILGRYLIVESKNYDRNLNISYFQEIVKFLDQVSLDLHISGVVISSMI